MFPLSIPAGKRYLADASGRPFLLQGDTAWSLMAQLSREDVVVYLNDRAARGFNAILVNLVEHRFADKAPANFYGSAPFTPAGDFTKPNEAYFAHCDYVIDQAAQRGILVLLVPCYLGINGAADGWYQEMQAVSVAGMGGYGTYVGNRYKRKDNILWVMGGDWNPPDRSRTIAVAQAIRAADGKLMTAHCGPETAAFDEWAGQSWLDVNTLYSAGDLHTQAVNQNANRPTVPMFMIEAAYEWERVPQTSAVALRRQAYDTMLLGGTGHVFGNNPIWLFGNPGWIYDAPVGNDWKAALGAQGSVSMQQVHTLLAARNWWLLRPDAGTLLTSAAGNDDTRVLPARATDGSFAVLYTPVARTMTVALGQLAGPRVNATWFDPSNGSTAVVPGAPFAASGTRSFATPGSNGTNTADWVLLLESVA